MMQLDVTGNMQILYPDWLLEDCFILLCCFFFLEITSHFLKGIDPLNM